MRIIGEFLIVKSNSTISMSQPFDLDQNFEICSDLIFPFFPPELAEICTPHHHRKRRREVNTLGSLAICRFPTSYLLPCISVIQLLNEVLDNGHVIQRAENYETSRPVGATLNEHHHRYAHVVPQMPCSSQNAKDSLVMLNHNQIVNDYHCQKVIKSNQFIEYGNGFSKDLPLMSRLKKGLQRKTETRLN